MTTSVSAFLKSVNSPFVFIPQAAGMHQAYLKKSLADGCSYAPQRDDAKKQKPNILSWDLLTRSVQASNVAPFESVFGFVAEYAATNGIDGLAELGAYVENLIDDNGNVKDPVLGERTWQAWACYAREHEPGHPKLVDEYGLLDEGTKDYDFYLNGVAAKFLLSLIREQMQKDLSDAVAVMS